VAVSWAHVLLIVGLFVAVALLGCRAGDR